MSQNNIVEKTIVEESGIHYTVIVSSNKDILWTKDGVPHRINGPAVKYFNGDKHWHKNGKLHREDGPAVEHANGYKCWYKEGIIHRKDGPAVECPDGYKEYWLNGKQLKNIKTDKDLIIKILLE